jgi:MFS family permease
MFPHTRIRNSANTHSTFGSSVYTPGIKDVMKYFNVSQEAAIVPLTVYVLGLGFGPMLSAPLSETFGRRAVYLSIFAPSLLFTLGAGLAQNFTTLVVCRFFAGMLGSGCLAVGAGTNSDVFAPISRAASSSIFLLAPFLGPALGPPVGGFAAQAKGWRWTQWPILFIGAVTILVSLPSHETYKKIILQHRAKRLNITPPPNPLPPGFARIKFLLLVTILRPVRMLFTEPIVAFLSVYTAFNFSVLFGFFDAFPIVFGGVYHWNTGETGLSFLGIGIGCVLATGLFILIDRLNYRKKTLRRRAAGDMSHLPPEDRLVAAIVGSFLLPLSLFWFAWTAREDIHWISPLIATIFFGAGNLLIFCSAVLYLIDTYQSVAGASAAAANGLLRYVCGAVFPLFTVQMYQRLGIGWATSLLGFVTVGLLPIPWILFWYGERIRARSEYAPK